MTQITCVGVTVRDLIFEVPVLPHGAGKVHATGLEVSGGGVAANAAASIAVMGGRSRLISAVGDGSDGRTLVEELEALGVDCSGVRRVEGVTSPVSAIAVEPGGERSIVNFVDPDLFSSARLPSRHELADSQAILVDVRWPDAATIALESAAAAGVPGIVDYDVGRDEARPLAGIASHVVFSRDGLRRFSGCEGVEQGLIAARGQTAAWLAVTSGAEGTYWLEGERLMHMPAFEVDAVDTTGAGDVFHGAFALRLGGSPHELESAIEYASAAAGIVCTRFGGRTGMPHHDEVNRLIDSRVLRG